MVIKVYISSCSGNIEIKRKQDFVITVLNSKKIEYEEVDIADAAHEEDKLYMRQHAKPSGNDRVPLPPQIFSDDQYCGNYDGFHEANEDDAINQFLGLSSETSSPSKRVDDSYIGGGGVTVLSVEGDYDNTGGDAHVGGQTILSEDIDAVQSHNGDLKQEHNTEAFIGHDDPATHDNDEHHDGDDDGKKYDDYNDDDDVDRRRDLSGGLEGDV